MTNIVGVYSLGRKYIVTMRDKAEVGPDLRLAVEGKSRLGNVVYLNHGCL